MSISEKQKIQLTRWCYRVSLEMDEDEVRQCLPDHVIEEIYDMAKAEAFEHYKKEFGKRLKKIIRALNKVGRLTDQIEKQAIGLEIAFND